MIRHYKLQRPQEFHFAVLRQRHLRTVPDLLEFYQMQSRNLLPGPEAICNASSKRIMRLTGSQATHFAIMQL